MSFFYKFFNKDIKFFKSFNDRKKKIFVYLFLIFSIFLIFFIKIEKIIIFLILLSILLIWKTFMEFFLYVVTKNEKLKIFIRKYDSNFTYIIEILLFIQKWKNPFLVFLLYFDKLIYRIVRNLIYKVKIKFNYDLTDRQLDKVFSIYYFIINLMFGPFKLFFGFIYRLMNRMIEYPFSLFFIVRIIGFVLSVLIFSDLYHSLYNKFGPFYLFIFVYFFLIFINCMIKYIERDFEQIKYINNFINTDYIIYLRNRSTFCGLLILTISWYKITLIDKKYIDITSSYLKLELYQGLYKYWEYYKKNTWFNTTNIWKEIKNRPSFYMYTNIIVWIHLSSLTVDYGPSAITNIIFFKIKIEKLNLKLPEDIFNDLDFLYNFFLLRLKLLLFIIYDINDYIGNDRCDYIICKYDKRLKFYDIESDLKIFNFFDWDNFKIEKNKEDLPFYDLEINIEFFDRLYTLIDIVPVNEDPLELTTHSAYFIKVKNLVDNMELRLDKFYNLTSWTRCSHYYISSKEEEELLLVEKEVKNWIDVFLKETREDWHSGLKRENLKDRNWRMLNEIEDLFLER
jgi:hypothetical protein